MNDSRNNVYIIVSHYVDDITLHAVYKDFSAAIAEYEDRIFDFLKEPRSSIWAPASLYLARISVTSEEAELLYKDTYSEEAQELNFNIMFGFLRNKYLYEKKYAQYDVNLLAEVYDEFDEGDLVKAYYSIDEYDDEFDDHVEELEDNEELYDKALMAYVDQIKLELPTHEII